MAHEVLGKAAPSTPTAHGAQAQRLLAESAVANAALMRGDTVTYARLVELSDDFSLMTPFGGPPSHGNANFEEQLQSMRGFFRNGSFRQETVQTYSSADLVVLVVEEHSHVEVGDIPAQHWSLRVTLVYRREGGKWLLAHRHADPLVHPISVKQSAELARGAAG